MGLKSVAILNKGKENITKLLVDLGNPYSYYAIGVGNDGTDATEDDDPLKGSEQSWKDANRSYFIDANGSYIAQWNATFNYGDLPSNSLKEIAIAQNITNGTANGLIRITFDEIILGSGSSVNFQIQISPTQG